MKEQLVKSQSFLKTALNNGFCPYSFLPGQSASIEATAWALVALASSESQALKPAVDFLVANQNDDGGWSTGPGMGGSDWTSGPAILALRLAAQYQPQLLAGRNEKNSLKNALHYLLSLRVDSLSPVARLLLFLSQGNTALHYARGWPWDPECYNWVEPTAYCLMALKLPNLINDDLTKSAIFHANKFLLEHACQGGGWNHGCYYSLGVYYPPYTVTTAEALLALVDVADNNKVKDALHYLDKGENNLQSAMSLAWTILALDAYGCDTKQKLNDLLKLQNEDGSFGMNYLVTALSVLALNTTNGVNPLKMRA